MEIDRPDWALRTLGGFAELWRARRPGPGRMPSRRDFAMEDFLDMLGWVCIYGIEGTARPRFKIRLEGSAIEELDGARWTGRYLDEKFPPLAYPHVFKSYDDALAEKRPILTARHVPIRHGLRRHLAKLVLPLAEDGLTPDRFIAVLYYGERLPRDIPPGRLAV